MLPGPLYKITHTLPHLGLKAYFSAPFLDEEKPSVFRMKTPLRVLGQDLEAVLPWQPPWSGGTTTTGQARSLRASWPLSFDSLLASIPPGPEKPLVLP